MLPLERVQVERPEVAIVVELALWRKDARSLVEEERS